LPRNTAIFIIKVSLSPVALCACATPQFYAEQEYEIIHSLEMMTLATCKSQRSITKPASPQNKEAILCYSSGQMQV
jgi:hypothetical protein